MGRGRKQPIPSGRNDRSAGMAIANDTSGTAGARVGGVDGTYQHRADEDDAEVSMPQSLRKGGAHNAVGFSWKRGAEFVTVCAVVWGAAVFYTKTEGDLASLKSEIKEIKEKGSNVLEELRNFSYRLARVEENQQKENLKLQRSR